MSSKPIFLDVDPSLVEKNLLFTSSENEQVEKLLSDATYPTKVVKPSPGFCVKTAEVGTNTKVFINVCQTDAIPPPKDISAAELEEVIASDEFGDYKVPMSIGEIKTDKDKNGQNVKVCDVAIHPTFFRKVNEIQEFKNFLMALVFHGIENKYGVVCVDNKIVLQNRKVFGTLQMHRVQQREIEEKMKVANQMSIGEQLKGDTEKQRKVVIETISSTENVSREPEYRLYMKKNGHNCLYGEFKLPDIININELTLDIGEDRILLESKNKGYLLDIFVPYIIKQKACKSNFDRTTKILTVTMPMVGG